MNSSPPSLPWRCFSWSHLPRLLVVSICAMLASCAGGINKFSQATAGYAAGRSFVYEGTVTSKTGQKLPVRMKYTINNVKEELYVSFNVFVWLNGQQVVPRDKIIHKSAVLPKLLDVSHEYEGNPIFDRSIPGLFRQGMAWYNVSGTSPSSAMRSGPVGQGAGYYKVSRQDLQVGGRTVSCRVVGRCVDKDSEPFEEAWYSEEIPGLVAMVKNNDETASGDRKWEVRFVRVE